VFAAGGPWVVSTCELAYHMIALRHLARTLETPLLPDAEPTLLFAICYRGYICRYRAQHTTAAAVVSGVFPPFLDNCLPRVQTRREVRVSSFRSVLSTCCFTRSILASRMFVIVMKSSMSWELARVIMLKHDVTATRTVESG